MALPALSFRTKLILAMTLLVVGVALGTLLITRSIIEQSSMEAFQDRFRTEIRVYTEKREAKLQPFKDSLLKISRNPRLIALLGEVEAAAPDQDQVDIVYQASRDIFRLDLPIWRGVNPLRSIRATGARTGRQSSELAGSPTNHPWSGAGWRQEVQPPVLLLDARGRVLWPSRLEEVALKPRGLERVQRFLSAIGTAAIQSGRQQTGYLAPAEEDGSFLLREVICTPIIDQIEKRTNGAMLCFVPVSDQELGGFQNAPPETARHPIISGILVEDDFYSGTIPPELQETLVVRVGSELRRHGRVSDKLVLEVEGDPRQVFCQRINSDADFPAAYQVTLYSLSDYLGKLGRLKTNLALAVGVAFVGALGLSWLLSHGLVVPIRQLVDGTTEIERGNYNIKVPVRSRDEIGQLTASFNTMAEGLVQKEKFRSLLNLVSDKKVAEELLTNPAALGGELREVSVLFCDIRGFTSLTQGRPPAEVIEMLNEHMTILTRVVYEHNGIVDKFVGDLIMAVFGAPRATPEDTWNAAHCARRMIEERDQLNLVSRHHIQVGIGLATGQAVAGCMGSSDRLNYTVLGERVNLAARLCSQAGRMEVVIDAATEERLRDCAVTTPLPPLKLKGFSDPVPAFKLLKIQPRPGLNHTPS
jgi:class 3 adenylate cyclase